MCRIKIVFLAYTVTTVYIGHFDSALLDHARYKMNNTTMYSTCIIHVYVFRLTKYICNSGTGKKNYGLDQTKIIKKQLN